MDAWATQMALPTGFPPGSFITRVEQDEKRAAHKAIGVALFTKLPPNVVSEKAPEPSSFVSVNSPGVSSEIDQSTLEKAAASMTRQELLSVGLHGKKNSKGIEALEYFLLKNPEDPASNAARLRLSRRLLAKGDFAKVKELLSRVALSGTAEEKEKAKLINAYGAASEKGARQGFEIFGALASDQTLTPELRSHAMRLAAGHAHAAREYTTAVLAFRQLEAEAPSLAEREEAALQLCGLQVELVGRGKGDWPEAILSCEDLANRPGVSRQIKATAELMRFECLSHSGRTKEALAACESYLKEYTDIGREYVSASTWYGVLLVKSGRREEAVEALKGVLELEVNPADKFGGHEPKARAAYWLAFLALQRDDMASRDNYINYIKTTYPQSLEAQKLSALLPTR